MVLWLRWWIIFASHIGALFTLLIKPEQLNSNELVSRIQSVLGCVFFSFLKSGCPLPSTTCPVLNGIVLSS